MSLVACPACNHPVSYHAENCPACGQPIRKARVRRIELTVYSVLLILVLVGLVVSVPLAIRSVRDFKFAPSAQAASRMGRAVK